MPQSELGAHGLASSKYATTCDLAPYTFLWALLTHSQRFMAHFDRWLSRQSSGSSILYVEWVLLFVLWAPVLGALLLRAAIESPDRRARTVDAYVRAAIFLHVLALPPMFISWGVALLVLAGFDAALLLMVWAARRDERTLARVLQSLEDPATAERGIQLADDWLNVLARRVGADGIWIDHALSCAEALDSAGHSRKADDVLECLPRAAMTSMDRARVDLALAFHALTRNELGRARELLHRTLEHAPSRSPEETTAHAFDALIDAVSGQPRQALLEMTRVSGLATTTRHRAVIALVHAHVLSAQGELAAARRVLRNLGTEARLDAERIALGCPGPASPLIHMLDRPHDAPYR